MSIWRWQISNKDSKNSKGENMKEHKLSNQAIGAIMMALQKSLLEQSDIVPVLKNFAVQVDDSGELVVMNPPKVEIKTHATNSPVLEGPL